MISSKLSFKPLFDQEEILEKRDCYLVDLRNGEYSDWHDEISYELQAQDIIRWADKNGIWKFDMFGHSMGAKLVQVMTILYPDRVNAVIAVDGAPVKQADGKYHPFYKLFSQIIIFMVMLEKVRDKQGLTRKHAQKLIKEEFKDNRPVAAMLFRQMDSKDKSLKWNRNS